VKIAIYWEQQLAGGVDTHLLNLLNNWPRGDSFIIFHNKGNKGFARIKSDIDILKNITCVPYNSIFFDTIDNPNSRFINAIKKYIRYLFFPLLFTLSVIQSKRLLARSGGFDAIIANNGGYPAAWSCLASIISSRNLKITKRILLIHHAAVEPYFFYAKLERYIDKKIQESATDIVAVSLATRKSLIDYRSFDVKRLPIQIIYNGIDTDRLNLSSDFSLRDYIGVDKDTLLFGVLGRIEKYKGHDDLIMAFSMLSDQDKAKVIIVFIGSGLDDEITRLKTISKINNVGKYVIFTGYLKANAFDLISQLDLLLSMTKDFEGFGLTIAEAMIVKTPVLATRVGGVVEFLDNSVGTLIDPEVPEQAAKKLKEFIKNPEPFREKTNKASKIITEKFTAKKMTEQFYKLVNNTQ
jgi:glycosyltransferase involved in cell wall biosynthesis